MTDLTDQARAFLGGMELTFAEANSLWKTLKAADEFSLGRRVLKQLRDGEGLIDKVPDDTKTKRKLCQQEALLTSKDSELPVTLRHDPALELLRTGLGNLDSIEFEGDSETLGIAAGILKRRWNDFGQVDDLRRAARFYGRGAGDDLGEDGYAHINAAFVDDLLAQIGDDPLIRRKRASALRERILKDLPSVDNVSADSAWFNTATRAEALFGLRRYADAAQVVASFKAKPAPWELETTARQIATIAYMHEDNPLEVPAIRDFFEALLPGAADAACSAVIGKVGLALSGGGFRASFYHLGVLAKLAELNVLRHVEVLSCVSGGSIVGACYWLALRSLLLEKKELTREDYIALVKRVIQHFLDVVATDLRDAIQPNAFKALFQVWNDQKGALDPELTARTLDKVFYQPLMPGCSPVFMHDLPFTPLDHSEALTGSKNFHPGKHNWLRAHKVPVLTLNATTVNTGHAWQFTPTWMGESPWAVHEAADSIPRLEWSWYEPGAGWKMELGRAVAASACVPGVFAPIEIADAYEDVHVQLVDGGVHDNQGTVSLLALNCNVVLVSDACGQLLLEKKPIPGLKGLASYARRSMDTLMERVRLANYADLAARQQTGRLRGLMFLHMKAGLDADTVRLQFSQESYKLQRKTLSPSGVRKDFQQALAELRTDLDAFTPDESHALMACGYQMASWAFKRNLAPLKALWRASVPEQWPFQAMLQEITSKAVTSARRDRLLAALRAGSKVLL